MLGRNGVFCGEGGHKEPWFFLRWSFRILELPKNNLLFNLADMKIGN